MKKCPFCGEELPDRASFCPGCASSLREKTEVRPYSARSVGRTVLRCALILCVLGICLTAVLWGRGAPDFSPEATEAEGAGASVSSETLPTEDSDGRFSAETSDVATADGTAVTDLTSGSQSTQATDTDSDGDFSASSEGENLEQTVNIYTPATAPLNGYYYYEGVIWYYETLTDGAAYDRERYPYEAHELVCVKGIETLAEDGVYRIPDKIYGRRVILVNGNILDSSVSVRYPFGSKELKNSIKTLYIPPDAYGITVALYLDCPNLAHVYVAGEEVFLNLSIIPTANLTVHSTATCVNTYKADQSILMSEACAAESTAAAVFRWEEWNPAADSNP